MSLNRNSQLHCVYLSLKCIKEVTLSQFVFGCQIHVHVDEFYKDKEEQKRLFTNLGWCLGKEKQIYDYHIKSKNREKLFFYSFTDLALIKCPRKCPRMLQYLSQKNVICPRKYTRKSQNGPRKIWHVWGCSINLAILT